MALFKTGLTAIRSNDHLILSKAKQSNTFVHGSISQYLLSHQINGVKFLFRNYEKQSACILNDESGSGKCFQCIAFCDAILRHSNTVRILIICQQQTSLEHWQFHLDCFIENVQTRIADNENDTQDDCTMNAVTIASIDYVLNNLSVFNANQMDCVIFQDQQLQTSFESFERLSSIKATYKIFLGSNDLMNDLGYFYELLKFCQQTGPLKRSKDNGSILSLDEFQTKFGGKNDKTISKRSQAFRQQILLNACSDFYLRRLCNHLGSQFPPISSEDFQTNFDAWKTINGDTVPFDLNPTQSAATLDDDFSPIELLPAPVNRTLDTTVGTIVTNDETSLLNTAIASISDFDTQMSPLIYSDSNSDDSIQNQSADIENSPSINSQQFTPDIVCNQEHAAKAFDATKATVQMNSSRQITPVKRALRTLHDKVSPSKRLNYKQLPIEIRSSSCRRSLSQTYLFRTKKQDKVANSTEIGKCESQSLNKMRQSNRVRSISSASDIQIISQTGENLSPIVISTSSEDTKKVSQEPNNQTKNKLLSLQEVSCPSPDLFTSFSSMKSDALSQQQQQQQPQVVSSQKSLSESQNETTTKSPLRDVFGAPDECDDIDLLSNTNVDIFEITKNSVFDNVLCSANDRITPLKTGETKNASPNPNVSCLSGLRIMFNKSNCSDAEQFQSSTSTDSLQILHDSSDDVLVDLTAMESQKIIEISSEDSVRLVEKTPERKQQLTPSTRSCLKRQPNVDEVEPRSGWKSAKRSPKTSARTSPDTPKSRRRLDRWIQRTDHLTTRPRNLCAEFKSTSRTDRITRRNMPSTSTAKSPPLFSDHE